jgi:hypothetical protein
MIFNIIYFCVGEKSNDLVIGCPTRFQGRTGVMAAFKSNFVLTLSAFAVIFKNAALSGFKDRGDMEDKIQANRVARMKLEHASASPAHAAEL